jgi:hypothetical protein
MRSSRHPGTTVNGTKSGVADQKQQPLKRRHSLPSATGRAIYNVPTENIFANLSANADSDTSPNGNTPNGSKEQTPSPVLSPQVVPGDQSTQKISRLLLTPNNSEDEIVNKIEETKKIIIAELKKIEKKRLANGHNNNMTDEKLETIFRTFVDHIFDETIEFLYWLRLNALQNRNVGIFYANDLFEVMKRAALESTNFDFHPEKMAHIRRANLDEARHLDGEKKPFDYENSIVYIPVCFTTEKSLQGKPLKKVIQFLDNNKVAEIVLYFGLGKDEQREAWLNANKNILESFPDNIKAKIKICLRSEIVKEKIYKEVMKHVAENLLKITSIILAVKGDILNRLQQTSKSAIEMIAPTHELNMKAIEALIKGPAIKQLMSDPSITPHAARNYGGLLSGLFAHGKNNTRPSVQTARQEVEPETYSPGSR